MKQLFESIWNMGGVAFALLVLLALALILTPFVWWFVRINRTRAESFERKHIDFDEQRRRVKEEMAKARGKML